MWIGLDLLRVADNRITTVRDSCRLRMSRCLISTTTIWTRWRCTQGNSKYMTLTPCMTLMVIKGRWNTPKWCIATKDKWKCFKCKGTIKWCINNSNRCNNSKTQILTRQSIQTHRWGNLSRFPSNPCWVQVSSIKTKATTIEDFLRASTLRKASTTLVSHTCWIEGFQCQSPTTPEWICKAVSQSCINSWSQSCLC